MSDFALFDRYGRPFRVPLGDSVRDPYLASLAAKLVILAPLYGHEPKTAKGWLVAIDEVYRSVPLKVMVEEDPVVLFEVAIRLGFLERKGRWLLPCDLLLRADPERTKKEYFDLWREFKAL